MSLFGALQSGVSGLAAQSNAMGAISDNISNVNTVGYKNTNVAFQTLVTKQTSTNFYAPGGVQPVSRQSVSAQGLLASNASSTALGISGKGFFVVSTSSEPSYGDTWAYTRAGDFGLDDAGYLKNTAGYYLQGWTLLPWDGNSDASVVNINGINYMKAYYNSQGDTVYINDNIVDSRNLRPINLSTIGGTATATHQVKFGANLPANAPVYDPSVPSAGGRYSVPTLIYDSLGNSSNISLNFIKESSNSWGMDSSIPPKAAVVTLSGSLENFRDEGKDVYSAIGQLEFNGVPAEGSSITIADSSTGQSYKFVFTKNPANVTDAGSYAVDLSDNVVSPSDFAQKFLSVLQGVMPDGVRFNASGSSVVINQSLTGGALSIDCSQTLSCVQASVNPDPTTGLPSGKFEIPAIDKDIKNVGSLIFTSEVVNDYVGKTFTVNGVTYELVNNSAAAAGNVAVNVANAIENGKVVPAKMAAAVAEQIRMNGDLIEPERVSVSGSTVVFTPTTTGPDLVFDFTQLSGVATGETRSGDEWLNTTGVAGLTMKNSFTINKDDTVLGSCIPAVRFNADGTPKTFGVDEMSIIWSNGAENMDGGYQQGSPISLDMGNVGTNEGLTSLSGDFNQNYMRQDGAKFGSYAGVSIDEQGVVTALFDNGETRAIAILPLATFANADGLSSLTGNVWIETDYSGQVLLKQAGTNGAGVISANSLEQSTVDLATEFSNMIITQRAYSASTKIITTADEMLDELTRLI